MMMGETRVGGQQMIRASEMGLPQRPGHFLRQFGQSDKQIIENQYTTGSAPQVMTLLNGVLDARGRVLLKLNVTDEHRDAVLAVLPSMKSPTTSPLAGGGYAVESVVEKKMINLVIPALREAGATDLVEMPIAKIVP